MRLPRGVAVMRIQDGPDFATLVDDTLSADQQLCARVFVTIIAAETSLPFVLLTKLDILAAMMAAAA